MATSATYPNGTITGNAIAPLPTSGQNQTLAYNLPSQTTNPVPTSPAVVTSKPATTNLQGISTNLANTTTGIKNQATNVANAQATAQQQNLDAQQRAQQAAAIQAKIDALKNTVASDSGTTYNQTNGFTTQNQQGKIPAGWDAASYSNFKSANPTLEPTAEDTARFQQTGQYTPGQTADNVSSQAYQQAQDTYNQITGIQNGTIPLTAGEQAQVDDLKNQFQTLITQTQTANTNYQNGLNILGAESGRERYTPETHLGTLNDAVQKGIQKIADLNSQMSAAVAKMEQGFKDDNIKAIRDANNDLQSAAKDRVDFLNKITADATAAVKDQRDFAYKQAQDLISNQIASEKFDYQKTQDAIDNMFKEQQITETQRANLADEAIKRAAQQAVDGGGIPNMPVVNMTADNVPSAADQAKFLASLPQDVQTLVKGMADYTINPNASPQKQYKGAAGLNQAQMLALVKQYDPTYDEKMYATRQAYQKSLTSGPIYNGIVAGNKAINHLVAFTDTMSKLGNTIDLPFVGGALNTFDNAATMNPTQRMNLSTANTEANGLKDELAKFFKGTGTTDVKSIDDWAKSLSTSASPATQHGLVQGAINLLAGQLDVVNQSYVNTMGKAPTGTIIQPATLQKLSTLKNQGYQVDIPGVNYTDKDAYFKYGGGSQTDLDTAFTRLKSLGIPATPDNILQAAQL